MDLQSSLLTHYYVLACKLTWQILQQSCTILMDLQSSLLTHYYVLACKLTWQILQ